MFMFSPFEIMKTLQVRFDFIDFSDMCYIGWELLVKVFVFK